MARCRQCGWLTGPTSLDVAIDTGEPASAQHPHP